MDQLTLPKTDQEFSELASARSDNWEYLYFAGALVRGEAALDAKWRDHLRQRTRAKQELSDGQSVLDFLQLKMREGSEHWDLLQYVLEPRARIRAFGRVGAHGDVVWIDHLASRLIGIYEAMLDWAASIRCLTCPAEYREVVELSARLVDAPIDQLRGFVEKVATTVMNIPQLLPELTDAAYAALIPDLEVQADESLTEQLKSAFNRLTATDPVGPSRTP